MARFGYRFSAQFCLASGVATRAYAYWPLRELLDPGRGNTAALPPDQDLLSDLAAPRSTNASAQSGERPNRLTMFSFGSIWI